MKPRKETLEERFAWMRGRQARLNGAPVNPIALEVPVTLKMAESIEGQSQEATGIPTLAGIERTMTFKEIMVEYGWKYHKVYRYYINHPRTGVQFTFNPGKRPKRFYDVPVSVVRAEWEMMHSANGHKAEEWERRHPYQKPGTGHRMTATTTVLSL